MQGQTVLHVDSSQPGVHRDTLSQKERKKEFHKNKSMLLKNINTEGMILVHKSKKVTKHHRLNFARNNPILTVNSEITGEFISFPHF